MSLPLAIAAIVFADLALMGLLTLVMSHARILTPHVPAAGAVARGTRPAPSRPARSSAYATPAGVTALPARV
jgi:hypothetical protein